MSAFQFRPALHGRNNPGKRGSQEIQEAEIVTGSEPLYACNVLHLGRENLLRRYRNERAAVRHEELQQQNNRTSENDSRHHRGTTASCEGTVRASSDTCQNVKAQDNGRKQPNNGVRNSKKEPRLWYRFCNAKLAANKLKSTPIERTS